MSVCMAEKMQLSSEELQDLTVCALLHDNALTQYIQEELRGETVTTDDKKKVQGVGIHCLLGEENMKKLPFHTDVKNVIL